MLPVRRYWKTAALAGTAVTGDGPLFLLDYLLRFLRVALLLSLWRVLLGGGAGVPGLPAGAVLTYTLVAEVFAEPLACRSGLSRALWEGTIAARFLQPLPLVGQFLAEMSGRWALGLGVFSLPLLLCAPLLGVDPRPAGPAAALLFVPALCLGISVGLALEFLFGAWMVLLDQSVWAFDRVQRAVTVLLSGALLPLAVLPWGLGPVFEWLPFAAMASAPLRIYIGTGDPLPLMALQLAWSLLLWPLAALLWRRSRERLVTYGET